MRLRILAAVAVAFLVGIGTCHHVTHSRRSLAEARGADFVETSCAHLHDLGCHDGPGGSCEDVYRRLHPALSTESIAKTHACILAATSLQEAEACGLMGCLP